MVIKSFNISEESEKKLKLINIGNSDSKIVDKLIENFDIDNGNFNYKKLLEQKQQNNNILSKNDYNQMKHQIQIQREYLQLKEKTKEDLFKSIIYYQDFTKESLINYLNKVIEFARKINYSELNWFEEQLMIIRNENYEDLDIDLGFRMKNFIKKSCINKGLGYTTTEKILKLFSGKKLDKIVEHKTIQIVKEV